MMTRKKSRMPNAPSSLGNMSIRVVQLSEFCSLIKGRSVITTGIIKDAMKIPIYYKLSLEFANVMDHNYMNYVSYFPLK